MSMLGSSSCTNTLINCTKQNTQPWWPSWYKEPPCLHFFGQKSHRADNSSQNKTICLHISPYSTSNWNCQHKWTLHFLHHPAYSSTQQWGVGFCRWTLLLPWIKYTEISETVAFGARENLRRYPGPNCSECCYYIPLTLNYELISCMNIFSFPINLTTFHWILSCSGWERSSKIKHSQG